MLLSQAAAPTYSWTFDLSVIVGLISLTGLYGYLILLARRDGRWGIEINWQHVIFFGLGILTLFLALQSPLDKISDEGLFAAHMVQHMLLAIIAPAFLLFGTPGRWLRAIYDLPIIGRGLSLVTRPLVSLLAFNAVLWVWHLPSLYEGALRDENIHIIQHLMFIMVGVLLWLPVVHAVPPKHPMGYLNKIAYLFFNMISTSILSAIFSFAGTLIYSFYGNAPLAFGLSSMDDQQMAGAIMWVPGGGIFLLAILITLAAWLRDEEHRGEANYPPPEHAVQRESVHHEKSSAV